MTTQKEIMGGIIAIVIAIMFISLASAEAGYCKMKLGNHQWVPVWAGYSSTGGNGNLICADGKCTCHLNSGKGYCQICTNSSGWYASDTHCSNVGLCNGDGGSGIEPNLTLTANFPFADNGVYTKQSFYFDISTNKIANIDLIDHIAGSEINLCPNCASYKKSRTFPEGQNDITVRAVDGAEVLQKRIRFFIDNKNPRIVKTTPLSNKYSSGLFSLVYDEANVVSIDLYYGKTSSTTGATKKTLSGCESGKNKECSTTVDLSTLDGELYYWFEIKDVANKVVTGRPVKILVDQKAPVINSIVHSVSKKNVAFTLNVTEKNLDKVYYYDNDNERKKVMCSVLKNGICTAKYTFTSGTHNLRIQAYDKAGNTGNSTDSFVIL